MTSVLLVLFLSQARIFMAMARDGLLPPVFGRVHPRFRTPHVATIVTGVVICLVAAFTPIDTLEEMVNIGTLLGLRHGLRGGVGAPRSASRRAAAFPLPDDLPGGPAGNCDQPGLDLVLGLEAPGCGW